ncbi:tRNA (adenine(58)-N(1))-methyltransferase catalytic subunit trmt61a [Bonamia ostreae]|uniref:tRNA (adenine(58)-N(1))-methyltransferase n=1 Tax=Bonamia ostreae TaxID=126728 RepID=A0ABV2AF43_9EUKA
MGRRSGEQSVDLAQSSELQNPNLVHHRHRLHCSATRRQNGPVRRGSRDREWGAVALSVDVRLLTNRAVAPDGHLFTFDVDKERILRAREEFAANGVGDFVSAVHRDVCKDGFPSLDQLREIENGSKLILAPRIDSVFLDLPSPWEAVKSGSSVLRKGGRMCSFSPCVEQAQKSICEMRKWSLSVTKTLSVVDTNFSCGKEFNRIFGDEVVHSGFLTLAIKT